MCAWQMRACSKCARGECVPGATSLAFGPVTPIAPLNVRIALAYAVAPAAESVILPEETEGDVLDYEERVTFVRTV
jgi:hypothetical protein